MSISNHWFSILMVITTFYLIGCGSTGSDGDDTDAPSIPSFNSGTIPSGESYSYTFDQEGNVEYYCELHAPNMQGQVTVSSSAEAADRDTVRMAGNQFQPQELTVAPNTEVVWINSSNEDHTVIQGNPSSNDDGDTGY